MPLTSTKALVLGTSPFNEQDKLVFLLTPRRGILKAIAPGAAKIKNRFGSLLELFCEGEFHYYWKEDKELVTLSKGEIIHSHFHLVSRPERIFYFYLLAEILIKFFPWHSHDNRVFTLTRSILKNSQTQDQIQPLLLYFLIWIIHLEGLLFNPRACTNCQAKNPSEAWVRSDYRGLLCNDCRRDEAVHLSGAELEFLDWVLARPPQDAMGWRTRIDCRKLIVLFCRKIEYHGELTLQSTRYLSEFR